MEGNHFFLTVYLFLAIYFCLYLPMWQLGCPVQIAGCPKIWYLLGLKITSEHTKNYWFWKSFIDVNQQFAKIVLTEQNRSYLIMGHPVWLPNNQPTINIVLYHKTNFYLRHFICLLYTKFILLLAFPVTPSHSRDLDTEPDGYHETEMVSVNVDVNFDVCPHTSSSPAPTSIQ